jgi:TolB-like protein/Tfp pilus assembly protein PilF
VFRAAGIYVVAAWIAVQVVSLILPAIDVPDAAIRHVWLIALFLFPLAVIFSWFYEYTSTGLERTPPADATTEFDLSLRRLDYFIVGALAVIGAAIAWQLSTNIRGVSLSPRVEFAALEVDPYSIAVLPLANLSGETEELFFVSGMQDALISGLSRIRALKVISKASTLRFSGAAESLPDIASQLGVARLVEGSVSRVGEQVRISVQLIDAVEDRHIWSDTFEDDITNVLKLQNEAAQAIAAQVEVVVSDSVNASFKFVQTVNPAAYEAYLKGQFHVERFTPQDMMAADQYYQQSVELDPGYALAYYGLSKLCGFQAQAGIISPDEARERCHPPIVRALEIDPNLPEAHMGYAAHMTWQRFDWEEGAKGFERAIELNPSYAEARMFYSHYLALIGNEEESVEQMRLALELDPFNPLVRGLYGVQLMMIGDFQGCVDVIEEVMATTPGFGFGYGVMWHSYHALGLNDEAIKAAANNFRITAGDETGALALEEAYVDGDYEAAMLHAADVLAEYSKISHVAPINVAGLYEHGGDIEKAMDWFEKAVRNHDPDAPYLGVLTAIPATQSHPRFIALLREMKLDYWADLYLQEQSTN